MTLEITFILLLIIANGVLAMSETAVVSSRKTRLEQWANEGNHGARVAFELANDPTRFLSTVQFGITLIGTFAGAFGGATIAQPLAEALKGVSGLAPYSESVAFGLVVFVITMLSLILGELVPKRLALYHPERIAAFMAAPMRALAVFASPFVKLLSVSTEGILRFFRVKPSEEPPITEAEVVAMIDQGTQAGVFEEAEQNMVEGVFRLADRRVSSLMTSRSDIVWLDLDDSVEEVRSKIAGSGYSRFPICQGSLDNFLGVVRVKDLLARALGGQPLDLRASLRQPLFVHEKMRALKVLELFKESRTHIALVIDEYGEIEGLLTLNDILEAIVGDVPNVGAVLEPQIVEREDGSWLIDGLLTIDEFKQYFDLSELPGDERGDFETVGGFVITSLEHIPSAGESFEWEGFRFEVVDMDGPRVDKILLRRLNKNVEEKEAHEVVW
ncbi:MAG: hemolysin family protein [bacterium]